ncbi:MAG: response regulator transcription factor, partial [Cytophagales bacterium]|nr:response regulator transcription factor [Cytophagales bacterium]
KGISFKAGGVDYVSKPFNQEELLARITPHLSLRNMQKSPAEQNARLQSEIIERKHDQAKKDKPNENALKNTNFNSNNIYSSINRIFPE